MKRQANIFGFGSKAAAPSRTRRSSLTISSASKQAREAGYRGKDFREWLESKRLTDRSQGVLDRLGDAYRLGMDDREATDNIKQGLRRAKEIAKTERLAKKSLKPDAVQGIFGDLLRTNGGKITDRGNRYRAHRNMPEGPKLCGYCGARRGRLDVEHINGREVDAAPENLMYACRSCNVVKANVMRKARMGTKTNQYNPTSGGAKTLAQWLTAVSVVTPHKDRGQGSLFPLAGNEMSVPEAVAMIRATPPAKRSSFAREIASRKSQRRGNPAKVGQRVTQGTPGSRMGEYSGKVVEVNKETGEARVKWDAGFETWTTLDDLRPSKRNPIPAAAIGAVNDYLGYAATGAAVGAGAKYGSKLVKAATRGNSRARIAIGDVTYDRGSNKTSIHVTTPEFTDWYTVSGYVSKCDALKMVRPVVERKLKALQSNPRPVIGGARIGRQRPNYDEQVDAITAAMSRTKSPAKLLALIKKRDAITRKATAEFRRNPASAAAQAYEDFHGAPPQEFVTVKRQVHVHRHLAGAGTLRKLVVKTVDGKARVTIRFYSGSDVKQKTLLAFNEKRNQLFVEGGDQAVNLKDFGISKPHELETLGKVEKIDYFTTKTHLGSEGGTAVYTHKFRMVNQDGQHVTVRVARYPDLIYRVLDKQLEFSGGSYEILAEGINQ